MHSQPDPKKPKGTIARKLSRYSAVTVGGVAGTIAGFESAEAALVKTPSGQTIVDDPGAPMLGLQQALIDLNNDGIDEVLVTVATASILTAQAQNGAGLAGGTVGSLLFYPAALQFSNFVSSLQTFTGGDAATATFGTLVNSSGGALAPGVGNWFNDGNAATGFLGIEFDILGSIHYGWVHITWDPATDSATIHEWAYEAEPGGFAKVPEPSSLALLGLGVAGLAARRRRQPKEQ